MSLLSRRHRGAAAAGTNATSHWVWGEPATRRLAPDLGHTLVGYAIHHAMSVFWACGFEAWRARHPRTPVLAIAAGTAAVAYAVDYRVVPGRLMPGFERHLPLRSRLLAYAAFATGLALTARIAGRRREDRHAGSVGRGR
ncbi:hypothetical protein [Arenimonas composti]|uniref:Uncharacterized protein n=1 Tax=Arenimonas composti TR7-09 = DSM 18010 TaxID=1121013 RepID=A0A091BI81_9GAMM|nr:hypothetical protein [Arenimonas composti]KFN50479.1 hypothetical protein P873_07390 [Arenimonas composti TR7-09 = DSM 18010]